MPEFARGLNRVFPTTNLDQRITIAAMLAQQATFCQDTEYKRVLREESAPVLRQSAADPNEYLRYLIGSFQKNIS